MNISDKELEQAKNLINSFCIGEFGNATDFTKLSSVNIAYTTITDAEIPIQVTLDLERYYLMRTLDGHVIDKEEYDTFQDFYENCLEVLNFDDLVYVTDEQLQAFYGSLTYSLDNLAYNSDGTVDFDVVRDYAPNIPGKFMIYSDQSKGSEDEAQVLSLSGFTFSEDADRRKEEVKYINAHYTDIENTLVDLTKSRYMEHFLLRTKDKASTIEAGSLIKEAYNGIKLIRNSEDYKRWLNFYDGFHQYSFNNTMLIYMQNPSASLCAGFNTWKNKKRYVKAGEKGLKILAPITETVLREVPVLDDDGKPILDENGKEQTKKVKEKVFANKFYVTSTFDISQTEGEPMFIGNYDQLKVIYFQLLNYMFLSPFIARLRYQASLTNFSLTLFPFYAVLNGPKSAGKSAFLNTVQSIMFGKKLGGISPDVFTRTKMYGLLRESAGVPLHIEDITKNRFRDYCGEIVKYDSDLISEKILNHPTVIMTSNDIQTIKPEYSKRIYYSIVDAQLTNVVAASQHKKMVECRNKIGTSFYREYLKRIYPKIVEMLNDMENYVFDESSSIWEPDIFNLSSKVIISIYEDCKIQIPPYVTEVSYADYFGHNSLTQSVKEKIIFEWAHNRKAFKVLRKQNRLEYVAGEKAYEAVNICQALPEELIPKQSGAKVVLKLDSAEKFFGIHFKNRLF